MTLSGPGAFSKWRFAVCEEFAEKLPHPDAAATVNVTAVDVAVPPASELTESHAGGAFVTLSMVNGVPPEAADVTETLCAGPGVYVPLLRAHVIATVAGAVRPEVVAVTVLFAVVVASATPPARKCTVVAPVVAPTQPATSLMV
jgi:hypothetical protein